MTQREHSPLASESSAARSGADQNVATEQAPRVCAVAHFARCDAGLVRRAVGEVSALSGMVGGVSGGWEWEAGVAEGSLCGWLRLGRDLQARIELSPSEGGVATKLDFPAVVLDLQSLSNFVRALDVWIQGGAPTAPHFDHVRDWLAELARDREQMAAVARAHDMRPLSAPYVLAESEAQAAAGWMAIAQQPALLDSLDDGALEASLLAAWAALLCRFGGDSDGSITYALSCRKYDGLREAIGPLTRWIALPFVSPPDAAFEDLRRAVVAELARLQKDAEYILAAPEPGLRSQGCGFLFCRIESGDAAARGPGGELSKISAVGAPTSLTLVCLRRQERVELAFQYEPTCWHSEELAVLAEQFADFLRDCLHSPGRSVRAQPIAVHAPDAPTLRPRSWVTPTILHRIDEVSRKFPGKIALEAADEALSYADLDRESSRLARALRRAGVGMEDRVGLLLDRSPRLIVAMLGIWKAGAAYVPVDVRAPQSWRDFIWKDSGVRLILSDEEPVACDVPMLDPAALVSREDDEARPDRFPSPRSLAYVLFTSGSTGEPKGVAIEHEGLVDWIEEQTFVYQMSSQSRVLQFASPTFDASVSEIFGALAIGATLFVAPSVKMQVGDSLSSLILEHRITDITLPPSALEGISDRALGSLHHVTICGEAPTAQVVRRAAPLTRLINGYGITEACVMTSLKVLPSGCRRITIGRPIQGRRVRVIDAEGAPLAVGMAGELVCREPFIARGYWNRPGQTARVFRPDPDGAPGSRRYLSGDRVRQLPDGDMLFLGRIDHQIKLRGFRIELGQVESAIAADPTVREVCVILHRPAQAAPRLVAFVVMRGVFDEKVLRKAVAARVPEHMVPAKFIACSAIPKTLSGKNDSKVLAASMDALLGANATGRWETETERQIAELWSEVLGGLPVDRSDNWIDSGGDSLLALNVVARLAETFGLKIPAAEVLAAESLAKLAEYIDIARWARDGASPSPDAGLEGEL